MSNVKYTKRDALNELEVLLNDCLDNGLVDSVAYENLHNYVEKEKSALDKRAESAKKYAKSKAKANDEMTDAIYNVLTNEPQTIPAIVEAVKAQNAEMEITPQKATYRLSQMVKNEIVACETQTYKVEGEKNARRVKAYSKAQ